MAADVQSQLRRRLRVDLTHWRPILEDVLASATAPHYVAGMREVARAAQTKATRQRSKAVADEPPRTRTDRPRRSLVGSAMSVLNQRLLQPLRSLVSRVVGAMLESMTRRSEEVRTQPPDARAGAMRDIFDPARASIVLADEQYRARVAGSQEAARLTGVVTGFRWEATEGACKVCRKLHGKVVAVGEAFYVHSRPGPYQVVYGAPAHVNCRCRCTPVYGGAGVAN